jgi:predicted Co/Zn/Cd cation transporter (cation efflux family)
MGIIMRQGACLIGPALHAGDTRFHFQIVYVDPLYLMNFGYTFLDCP